MDNLFLVLVLISFVASIVFVVKLIRFSIKSNKPEAKKSLKFAGIAFGVMIVSFIGFGMSTDSVEESKGEETVAVTTTKETDEEKDIREKKEAEDKVKSDAKAAEEKAAADAKAKKEAEAQAKEDAEQKAKDEADAKAQAEADALEKIKVKSGTYKVGTDLAAGEYLVISNGLTYIESASDSTGTLESIVFNDNLTTGSHSYVTLNDGEYFKLQGGEMFPVDKAPSVIPEDGLYKDGMYKVGKDIPAGEYKVIFDTASVGGYLEVSANSSHKLESIVTNDIVQADMYITVKDGQYLKIQGVTIQK